MTLPVITMEDDLGIVYVIENAQQLWSELEDILEVPSVATLSHLDSALRRFVSLCATYHELYLQSHLQLEHACNLLLDSDLFQFHSERMSDLLVDDAQANTDPHAQLMVYNVLHCYGRRRSSFFRSHKRWQPLIPLLMDHVLVEIDPGVEDTYFGVAPHNEGNSSVPIEARLRSLSVRLLYEVCRVTKLSMMDLRVFDDSFLDHLFDLVEQTKEMHDETFNYSVIKLIVSLNEQFMVASLHDTDSPPHGKQHHKSPSLPPHESKNRVLRVLMRRLGSSRTFGENMIFMLNRARPTPEDLCMQLLVLKILYILFTTKGTSEYFYTNDLCVLVDVFLRELVDLDDESESLRHTYLRVLHPLLTKTQLRSVPYKRTQILCALESLTHGANIRDINPTTKRLVGRCLTGEWCVQLKSTVKKEGDPSTPEDSRVSSPSTERAVSAAAQQDASTSAASTSKKMERSASGVGRKKSLKSSRSVEQLKQPQNYRAPSRPSPSLLEPPRRSSNASTVSVAAAAPPTASLPSSPLAKRRDKSNSVPVDGSTSFSEGPFHHSHSDLLSPELVASRARHNNVMMTASSLPPSPSGQEMLVSPLDSNKGPLSASALAPTPGHRRAVPPAPPRRRKPPAVPVGRTNGGATITAIKSTSGNVVQPA